MPVDGRLGSSVVDTDGDVVSEKRAEKNASDARLGSSVFFIAFFLLTPASVALLQVLNVDRSSEKVDEVSLDFTVANNGQEVPADNALATLKNLSSVQMADIITYPVGNADKPHPCLHNKIIIYGAPSRKSPERLQKHKDTLILSHTQSWFSFSFYVLGFKSQLG